MIKVSRTSIACNVDEKRSLTLTLSKGRGDSGIVECSQLSHTEPLGRWPVGEKQSADWHRIILNSSTLVFNSQKRSSLAEGKSNTQVASLLLACRMVTYERKRCMNRVKSRIKSCWRKRKTVSSRVICWWFVNANIRNLDTLTHALRLCFLRCVRISFINAI